MKLYPKPNHVVSEWEFTSTHLRTEMGRGQKIAVDPYHQTKCTPDGDTVAEYMYFKITILPRCQVPVRRP